MVTGTMVVPPPLVIAGVEEGVNVVLGLVVCGRGVVVVQSAYVVRAKHALKCHLSSATYDRTTL